MLLLLLTCEMKLKINVQGQILRHKFITPVVAARFAFKLHCIQIHEFL